MLTIPSLGPRGQDALARQGEPPTKREAKGTDERQTYIRDNMESWEPGKLSKIIAEREQSFELASSECIAFSSARDDLNSSLSEDYTPR